MLRMTAFFTVFLLLGFLLGWDGAGVAGADPAEDDGVNESACAGQDDDCGNVCFWADCVRCTICEREVCSTDSEGVETCWTEYYDCAPCLDWVWHVYGEQPRRYGFYSPEVGQGADLALVDYEAVACEEGGTDHGWTGVVGSAGVASDYAVDDAGVVSGSLPSGDDRASFVNFGEFERAPRLADFADSLRAIPGEAGAPVIRSLGYVGADVENRFDLVADGGGEGEIQYRYWPYNGLVPNDVRVKFEDLDGEVTVDGLGVYAFQVRRLREDETVSGRSAVVYRLVNGSKLNLAGDAATVALLNQKLDGAGRLTPQQVYDQATPVVTPTPTARPPLADGVTAPPVPVITLVGPVSEERGAVWVNLNQDFAQNLQLRRWVHNGYLELEVREEWVDYGDVAQVFKVTGLDSLQVVPEALRAGAVAQVDEFGVSEKVLPLFWNFQVRLTEGAGEDLVVGEGSNVVVSTVGRGLPERPVLLSARSQNSGGRVQLTFARDYPERMEWRVWRHSRGNGPPSGTGWVDLGEQNAQAAVVVPAPLGGGPVLYDDDDGLPLFWDFQVRLVSGAGVAGPGSNVVAATVWW